MTVFFGLDIWGNARYTCPRLIDFYDMKIAAGDLSDYLIGFRVLASVRRRGPDLDGD